jgi:UDPglucose 6-dehydrogenase
MYVSQSLPGNGKAPDLKYVERAARDIAETVTVGKKIVVEKSTVPVKAAESINIILSANKKPGVTYQVSICEANVSITLSV